MTFDQRNQENSIVLPPLSKENEWKLGHFGLKRGRSGFFLEVESPGQTTPATIMIVAI